MSDPIAKSYLYRCRLCGEIYSDLAGKSIMQSFVDIILFGKSYGRGFTLYPLSQHDCKDGRKGLGDLIGAEPRDEQ